MVVIYAKYTQENRHTGDVSKCHENKKGLCGWKYVLGNKGGQNPSGLGDRLITVVRQAGSE